MAPQPAPARHEVALDHLCRVFARLDLVTLAGTPAGDRMVFTVTEGVVTGDRLRGRSVGAGADWFVAGPGGIGSLDVRFTLETDDGALVLLQYNGRTDIAGGPGAAPVYVAPRFETGDERYRWLNTTLAIGKGTFDPVELTITYDWYEVR